MDVQLLWSKISSTEINQGIFKLLIWVNSYYTCATIKLDTHSPNSSSEYICIYTCMYVCKAVIPMTTKEFIFCTINFGT